MYVVKGNSIFKKEKSQNYFSRNFNNIKEEVYFSILDAYQRQEKRIKNFSSFQYPKNFSFKLLGFINLAPVYSLELSNGRKNFRLFLGKAIAFHQQSIFQLFIPELTVNFFNLLVVGNQSSHFIKNQYCPFFKVEKFAILESSVKEINHYYIFMPFNSKSTYGQLGIFYSHNTIFPLFSFFVFKDIFFALEYRFDKSILLFSDKKSILRICLQRPNHKIFQDDNPFFQMKAMIKVLNIAKIFIGKRTRILNNMGFIICNTNSFLSKEKYSLLFFITCKLENVKITIVFDKCKPVSIYVDTRNYKSIEKLLTNKQKIALEKIWFY